MTTPVGHHAQTAAPSAPAPAVATPPAPAAPIPAAAAPATEPAPAGATPPAPARRATLASVVNSSVVRLALLAVLAVLAGVLIVRPTGTASGDYSGLATQLASVLNQQSGVSQTTGGYLPGTGVVLVSSVSGVTSDQLTTTLSAAVTPEAAQIKSLPSGEAVSWQANLSGSTGSATSWLVRVAPADAANPAKWVLAPVIGAAATAATTSGAAGAADQAGAATSSAASASADSSAAPAAATTSTDASASSAAAAAPTTAAASAATSTDTQASGGTATSAAATGSAAGSAAANTMTGGAFTDDFSKDSGQWTPLTGSWSVTGGSYRQTDNSGYDFISQLQATPGKTYTVSVRMRSLGTTANAGLILGQPALGTRNGAELIDLSGKDYVRWGQYDASSGTYKFVGGASLGATQDPTKWHTLSVTVSATATTVSWDSKEIGSFGAIAAGHLGLVTSQSAVEFDDFTVHA